jgi:hypothetical protein
LQKALNYYQQGEDIARSSNAGNLFYPAMNRMSVALAVSASESKPSGFEPEQISAVRQSLQRQNANEPDFWSVVGMIELRIYEALAKQDLSHELEGLIADLKDLRVRSISARMWASVADQARFTLGPYVEAVGENAEHQAACQLLAWFDSVAQPSQQSPVPQPKKRAATARAKRRKSTT